MTKGLLISRKRKIELCNLSLKDPNPLNILNFKNYRNLYSKIIKSSKKLHFEKALTKNQSNLKKTWQILRKAINKNINKENGVQNLLVNNVQVTDPKIIADNFNLFFTNVANDIVNSINPSPVPPPPSPLLMILYLV